MSARAAVPAQAGPESTGNETALGGGAVALLALGGAAYAMSRRRRHNEEGSYDGTMDREHVAPAEAKPVDDSPIAEPRREAIAEHQPPLVAPPVSAFGWGGAAGAVKQPVDVASDDRKPGETWVDRAYRGPTPDNPSLSLKKRLKRAAFFDKRERDAAEGSAAPIDADAGLPESAHVGEGELVDA